MRELLAKRVETVCSSRNPPRFHLMRTAEGTVFRCRADLPGELVQRLTELCQREPVDRALERLPAHHDRYLALLADHASVEEVSAGPAYMSLQDVAPRRMPQPIDETNAGLLRARFEDWLPDVPLAQPFMALIEDGEAVSICASVRISPAVHCAGVETHPDHRRKGHALDVVAAWAQAVRSGGAVPFYSTSWDNIASQGVARRLGFRLAGVDFNVT